MSRKVRETNAYKYKRIRISKTKTKDEHRLVMENLLGRKLARSEIIHHINGDHRDNRPENLMLTTLAEHIKIHNIAGSVPSPKAIARTKERLTGKPNYNLAKYSECQIRDWFIRYTAGEAMRKIAADYGINHTVISCALNGKTLAYKEFVDSLKEANSLSI